MEVYSLRVKDRVLTGLDPNLHVQWADFKRSFETRFEKGEKVFSLVEGNATTFSCANVNFSGAASELHIFIPGRKWGIFPIVPSVRFLEAIARGVPIKILLFSGKLRTWRLAVLVARQKLSSIYALNGKKFDLGPTSPDNDTFKSSEELDKFLKEQLAPSKRKYRKIVIAEPLPLPTSIPE